MELSRARILLTNDDGVYANGLKALERIARALSDDIWIVAPATEQSAASHSLTIARPLRVRQQSERWYAVDGTPTDSVLIGVNQVLKDRRPDLILSGVNRGGNLGEDVTYSGTIAAAMEGTLLGIPSIALSQLATPDGPTKWATAETHAPGIIRKLAAAGWPKDVLINLNFPNLPPEEVSGARLCVQGRRKLGSALLERHDPRGRPYYWIDSARDEDPSLVGTDLHAVNSGAISITPLYLDLTHRATIESLAGAFP